MNVYLAYKALSRKNKITIIAGIILFFYTIIGFFVLPPIIRSQLEKTLTGNLGRDVIIEKIKMNPYALSVTLRGFEIKEQDGETFTGFEELYVNFQLSSLFRRAFTFKAILLTAPHGQVVIRKDGSLNFSDLMDTADKPAPQDEKENTAPALIIEHVQIDRGKFVFSDLSLPKPFHSTVHPIHITLDDFSTQKEAESPYAFTATTGKGESFSWSGSFSVNPLRSDGHFEFKGIHLRTLWDYAQHQLGFNVEDGVVHLASDYLLKAGGDVPVVQLTDGSFKMENLKVREKETDSALVSLPGFSVTGITIDLGKREAVLDTVESGGARVHGWLDRSGSFNYTKLVTPKPDAVKDPASGMEEAQDNAEDNTPKSAPEIKDNQGSVAGGGDRWHVTVNNVSLDDYGVHLENKAVSPPLIVDIDALEARLKNVSTKPSSQTEVALHATLLKSGTVKIEGVTTLDPVAADMHIALEKLPIKPFQTYIHSFSRLDIISGATSMDGKFHYQSTGPGSGQDGLEMRYEGDLGVSDFEALNQTYSEDFLKWKDLTFSGVLFDLKPNRLHVSKIAFREPYARVMIWSDGRVNIKEVFASEKATGSKEAFPVMQKTTDTIAPKEEAMTITVDAVEIENGAANFADFSMTPNFFTGIQGLQGSIQGLSSDPSARADVMIDGKVDRHAPVKIAGQINPLSPEAYVDMVVSFKNMGLTPFTPYSGKFVGYTIEKGKLSLDLKYRLSDNLLVGENAVVLKQFTLGESVESPDATSLPVKLALALMKDRQGNIDLDLPVRGSLDDPEFSYGHLILKALVNVITKIITSPFSALASLVGGDGEEMGYVEFNYGSAELLSHQLDKLEKLAQALLERPALSLQIQGTAMRQLDHTALAEAKLMNELKRRKRESLPGGEEAGTDTLPEVSLTEEEFIRFLTQKYVDTYGHDPFTVAEEKTEAQQAGETGTATPSPPEIDPMVRMAMAKDRLIKDTPVDEASLQQLARDRARSIQAYLIERGNVPSERIFVLEVNTDAEGGPEQTTVRIELQLADL